MTMLEQPERVARQYGEGGTNQILSTIWGDTLHIADSLVLNNELLRTGSISSEGYFRAARQAHLKYLEASGLGPDSEHLARLNREGGTLFELGCGRGDLAELLVSRLWRGLATGKVLYLIAEISASSARAAATRIAGVLMSLGRQARVEDILYSSLDLFSYTATYTSLPVPVAVIVCDAADLLRWSVEQGIRASVVLFPESAMHMDLGAVVQSALKLLTPDGVISIQYVDLNPFNPLTGQGLNAILERVANAVLFRPIAQTTFMQRRFWPEFVDELARKSGSRGDYTVDQIDLDEDIRMSTQVTLDLLEKNKVLLRRQFGERAFRTMKIVWSMIRALGQGYYQIVIGREESRAK